MFSETIRLSNGVEVPMLALGTWLIDDDVAAEAVRQAVKLGYRHVDTAQAYANERGVGEGIRTCGTPREQLYDVIYLGTPIWHAQLPQPVASFLQQVDWSGKTVIVFGIHLGSGWGRNLQQIRELQPNAEVLEGVTVYASDSNAEAQEEMKGYLNK